jgi:hypothetical protein
MLGVHVMFSMLGLPFGFIGGMHAILVQFNLLVGYFIALP